MTPTDRIDQRRERAIDLYQSEHRVRAMVQRLVHEAMTKHKIFDAESLTYEPRDIARLLEDVAAQTLQMVYEEDAEIERLKAERDVFKKLAEECVSIRPPQYFVLRNG